MPASIVRRFCAAAVVLGVAGTAFTLLSSTSAGADPSSGIWERLRTCESSGNYHSVDANAAHFGAYQFDQSTWNSVGGQGRPDNANAAEQDYRALYLYRMRGWQPWQCADSAHLNLSDDASARTGRVPSYAESARIHTGENSAAPSADAVLRPPPQVAPAAPEVRAVAPAAVAEAPDRQAPASIPPVPASPLAEFIPPAGSGTLIEPTLPWVTIAYGTCSPILANWQVEMNRYGYSLNGAGCYDDQTAFAAHQLQYANGIQDGDTIGPYTLAAAYVGRAPR